MLLQFFGFYEINYIETAVYHVRNRNFNNKLPFIIAWEKRVLSCAL